MLFDVKDKDSEATLNDFQVFIDGTEVEDDKKTYTFGSKFKYVVKKLGYVDSAEKEHTVVDEEPNKIKVKLERKAKVSQNNLCSKTSLHLCFVVSSGHHSSSQSSPTICE